MPLLFDQLELRSLTLRNRIGMSPMCTYGAIDGRPQSWHLAHYGARATGGCALIIAEATAIEPRGRISLGDCGLWNDAQVARWRPVADFIRSQGAVPAVQLGHAGRKAGVHSPYTGSGPLGEEDGWQPVAPSALPFDEGWPVPHQLESAELVQLALAWGAAARRARAAGFGVLELHMAHGFLLHQFLSPLTNVRTDEYGGELAGRMRFPLEVVHQVRLEWPDELPLLVRVSATDWAEGGWDIADTVELCRLLGDGGADLIDCSSGGAVPQARLSSVASGAAPGDQVEFAERIRRETGLPTAAVGLISEPRQAEAIIGGEQADLVLLGRALLRDPYWPLHAARALGQDLAWPVPYRRAAPGSP